MTFTQAAEQHLDDVYGYLLYLARDRETAEDLASATFEKALRLWGRFDPHRGSARTWLLGIVCTTALDWFRAEGRRRPPRGSRCSSRSDSTRCSARVSRRLSKPRCRRSAPGSAR